MRQRDWLQKVDDTVYETVTVPEWPDEDGSPSAIRLRSLTSIERDAFEEQSLVRGSKGHELNLRNIRARLVVLSAVTEEGAPLFEPADVIWLAQKNGKAMDRLFEVAQRLSGMRDTDLESLVKNSGSVQSDDSGLN